SARHPFDESYSAGLKRALRYLKLQLRVKELGGQRNSQPHLPGQPKQLVHVQPTAAPMHLPLPAAVRPVVTS
ncbi:MAG TPA: hypothetical protein VNX28_16575, partial [Gemmataceae bacterium]|nr:hypothetical protein [Gemmataceae bacterium]